MMFSMFLLASAVFIGCYYFADLLVEVGRSPNSREEEEEIILSIISLAKSNNSSVIIRKRRG